MVLLFLRRGVWPARWENALVIGSKIEKAEPGTDSRQSPAAWGRAAGEREKVGHDVAEHEEANCGCGKTRLGHLWVVSGPGERLVEQFWEKEKVKDNPG